MLSSLTNALVKLQIPYFSQRCLRQSRAKSDYLDVLAPSCFLSSIPFGLFLVGGKQGRQFVQIYFLQTYASSL